MCRPRALALVLVLSLALLPRPVVAQAPPAAESLAHLFTAETVGYLEVQFRPGGEQGGRLERLLGLLRDDAGEDARWAWVRLVPRLARAAAVGVTPSADTAEVVGAVAADDPGALLSLILRGGSQAPPSEPYEGVLIYRLADSPGGFLAVAGGYLLAASSRDALIGAIDRARARTRAGPGLGGTPRYQATVARLPAPRVATAFLDGPSLADWIERLRDDAAGRLPDPSGGVLPPGLPGAGLPGDPAPGGAPGAPGPGIAPEAAPALPDGMARGLMPGGLALGALGGWTGLQGAQAGLDAYRAGSMALAVTAEREGLRLVFQQPLAPTTTPLAPSTAAALRLVPPEAVLAIAGHGLGPAARQSVAEYQQGLGERLPGGLDLERDLLDWMDGEFGFALVPGAGDARPPGGAGARPGAGTRRDGAAPTFLALFEVRDPAAVEARLRDLARRLAADLRLPRAEPIEERQSTVQVRRLPLSSGTEITWGYLGDWLFVTTGRADAITRAADSGGLAARPAYNRLAPLLPRPSSGVYYLDLAGLLDFLGMRADGARNRGEMGWLEDLRAALGSLAGATGLPADGWLEHVALLEVRW